MGPGPRAAAVAMLAALLACASGSGPAEDAAPPPSAPQAAPAPVPEPEPAWAGDEDTPPDHPYADLRARLEEQREGKADPQDPVAPLRETLARQAQEQIEAQRWGAPSKPGPDAAELEQLSDEIAEDSERRRRDEEAKRLRQERKREIQVEVRRASFEAFEQAPLRNCVPSLDYVETLPGDFIFYRELQRDDFRAKEMGNLKTAVQTDESLQPGAHVSITLLCVTTIRIYEQAADAFEARLHDLRFYALINRDDTWWNDEGDHVSEKWTLRHEQIHFDLAEVEARRLNKGRDVVMRTLLGNGDSPETAVLALQNLWAEHFQAVRDAFMAMEMQYDRETRHGKDLPAQTRWFTKAKRSLAGSEPLEPPPGPPTAAGPAPPG